MEEPGLLYMSATAVIGGLASLPLEVLAVTSVDCLLPTIGRFINDCFLAPLGDKLLGEARIVVWNLLVACVATTLPGGKLCYNLA